MILSHYRIAVTLLEPNINRYRDIVGLVLAQLQYATSLPYIMIPVFKPKYAAPNAVPGSLQQGLYPEASKENSAKVVQSSKAPVSLTDSQYDDIFDSVSKRVLESDFLDLDKRFAGSQEALENGSDIDKLEVQHKMVQRKRKKQNEKEVGDVNNATATETFAESISKISPESNKRDNEVTPSVSPQEQNTVVIKKPKPKKPKRKPTFIAKRKSLEYSKSSDGTVANLTIGSANSETKQCNDDAGAMVGVTHNGNDCNDTWVQCSKCEKWRLLPDCKDPTMLPDIWTCSMNTVIELAKCNIPEDSWDDLDSQREYIYTKFAPGSLVWAKMDGYPPWPSMVDYDPDNGVYYEMSSAGEVSHYHVVFLDDKVSRAWVATKRIEVYREDETPIKLPRDSSRRSEFIKDLHSAKKKASEAAGMSVTKRMESFSFKNRFRDHSSREKKQKRKSNHKISSGGKASVDKAHLEAQATVHFQSSNDESAELDNQGNSQDNAKGPSLSQKQLPASDTSTQNNIGEQCESKDTSVISMSDVSLEKPYEDVLQQGMRIEECDSSLNLPFVVLDKKSKTMPIEFDPEVFTMEMKHDGFADVYDSEKSPVSHSQVSVNEIHESKVLNDKALNEPHSPVPDNWLSPSKDTGISADNMFESITDKELDNADHSGNWDEFENLVMDIPDCLQ